MEQSGQQRGSAGLQVILNLPLPTMPRSSENVLTLDPSPRARRLLWHLLSIGAATFEKSSGRDGMPPRGALWFFVRSGRGRIEVDGRSCALAPGPRCWLVGRSSPRIDSLRAGQPVVCSGFRFGGPELEAWMEELGDDIEFELEPDDFALARQTASALLRLARHRPAGYEWDVHVGITQVLGRLLHARRVFRSPGLEIPPPVSRAIGLVAADPCRQWRVSELAAAAGASRSSLQLMFKRSQHESVREFLQCARLDQARQLLCDERLAIKEVSARLNFSSEFYFSRFIRKKTGMSPRRYRDLIRATARG